MANVRRDPIQMDTTSFNPLARAASGGGRALPEVTTRPSGEEHGAQYTVAKGLSEEVGRWADQMAQAEGERAGKVAGTDPDWRPSTAFTIRGQASERAAEKVYLSSLDAKFQRDSLDLWDRHREDPVALANGFAQLRKTYDERHVYPEAKGYFDSLATNVETAYRRASLNAFQAKKDEQARATLTTNMASRAEASARVLAVDPSSPEAEAIVRRAEVQDILDIQNNPGISEDRKASMIIERKARTHAEIVDARARTLGSAEDVQAYREKVKKDFAEGRMPGLDHASVDAALQKIANAKRVEGDRAYSEFDSKVTSFLDRASKGLPPPTSEWLALEDQAKKAGPQAVARLDQARNMMKLRGQIENLPLDQAERRVRELEEDMRNGSGAQLRPYLAPGRATAHTDNLDSGFAGGMARMFADMPPEIRNLVKINSGHRTTERQAELYQEDIARNGGKPSGRVAPPGGSNHEHGQAADLLYDGKARPETEAGQRALEWVHANAEKYGLQFRLLASKGASIDEPWHIEPTDMTKKGRGSGVSAMAAPILEDARKTLETRRALVAADPLAAASREGVLASVSPVDWKAGGEALAQQLPRRIAEADAVASHYGRSPVYLRPDEKEQAKAALAEGGDNALDLISGVISGGRQKAAKILEELSGDAPALAHAGMVMASTGDKAFARQVAEAQRARTADGGKLTPPPQDDVDQAMRKTLGSSLNGLSAEETARTRAAASAWATVELWRRGADPKTAPADILEEAVRRARGMTGSGDKTFGGVEQMPLGSPGKLWGRNAVQVQIPADVRSGRFRDALGALRDEDIASMPSPPVATGGRPLTAREFQTLAPVFTPQGYRFGSIDPVTGIVTPVQGKDGKPFTLNWGEWAPRLRERIPGAFRS